ncbi:hypothetical protein sce5567 [Sorangium cellulosum So ce56]|uniref:AAA+ ATPase domain-containing protein n=1 Tax=Sorangium cellulosum (strain So ce56) TaxID=448385 RepID=A9G372_SORC5|nr:hypothetical protein sce5567 [Sorangium cellulosum So ce56]
MNPRSPSEAIAILLDRYRKLPADGLNEANTRIQFVNYILEHVLGWRIEDFNAEEYVDAEGASDDEKKREWLDYHLRSGETIRLVVEAKRIGSTFSLPANRVQRKIPLRQLLKNNSKPISEAIRQAQKYCLKVGTLGFVVTNGFQWIASVAFAHNVPADKIQAAVFYNLEDIQSNLQEFIDLLSPPAIADQSLMTHAIAGGSLAPTFARRLNQLLRPGEPQGKNYLAQPLHVLMNICFADLTDADHAEMLERCYVSSEAADGYLTQLESFVGTTLPHGVAPAGKIDRGTFDTGPFTEDYRNAGASVLLIGRAGSGKSTFLAITRKRLEQKFGKTGWVLLHVDLYARTQTHATNFDHDRMIADICGDLLVQAEERYPNLNPFDHEHLNEIFAGEIRRLRTSLSASARSADALQLRIDELIQGHIRDPHSHLKAYLGYLRRKNVSATILLDNVDRGTEEFERVTFQLAQALALNTKATVVTSLRDTTYHNGKVLGFLDVGRHIAFSVSPPPFTEVVRRRFEYARERLRVDTRLSVRFERALAGMPSERVYDFANILAEMILGDNRDIQECISFLAGTNIRRALELLEDFSTSPNTDLDKLFQQYQRAEKRQRFEFGTPIDAFLRSIMLMRSLRYSESASRIANLFQVSQRLLVSHFTAIRILQFLSWRANQVRETMDIPVDDLVGHLGAIGHSSVNVVEVLNHLGKFGLVVSLSQPEPPWSRKDVVRLGAAGRYYLDELMYSREYVRNVVDDTYLYEEATLKSIELLHHDRDKAWPQRAEEKAKMLLLYLARREHEELNRIGISASRPPWLKPVIEDIGTRQFGPSFAAAFRSHQGPSKGAGSGSVGQTDGRVRGTKGSRPPPRG